MRSETGSTFLRPYRVLTATLFALFLAISFQVITLNSAQANPLYAGLVIDAKTGKVLYSRNADARRYPASLTKMMTLYLVFEDLKAGRITRSTRIPMTREGATRPPSKIGLRVGQSMSVNQAILALVTKSANDVASAIGGKLAGSEAAFARRMTRKARELGMKRTTFKNASGLTARGQVTTARDMATLGLALREHFPNEYKVFKTRVFKFGKRRYGNHNKLLGRVRGVDGIKTGYTRASGFNLVSSVESNGRSIVAVVMGGRTGARRNAWMKTLISRYLPKASRGKKRLLVARATGPTGTSSIARVSKSLANIDNVPSPTFAARTHSQSPQPEAAVKATPVQETAPKVEAPSPAPISGQVSGWQIQLAAGTNRDELKSLLLRVQRNNPSLLREAEMHMPRASGGARPVYRARFAGFDSKSEARNACKALKRQKMDCLAISG